MPEGVGSETVEQLADAAAHGPKACFAMPGVLQGDERSREVRSGQSLVGGQNVMEVEMMPLDGETTGRIFHQW